MKDEFKCLSPLAKEKDFGLDGSSTITGFGFTAFFTTAYVSLKVLSNNSYFFKAGHVRLRTCTTAAYAIPEHSPLP